MSTATIFPDHLGLVKITNKSWGRLAEITSRNGYTRVSDAFHNIWESKKGGESDQYFKLAVDSRGNIVFNK